MRRMLRAVGVEPRPRGTAPKPVPVPDLIQGDLARRVRATRGWLAVGRAGTTFAFYIAMKALRAAT
jgi:hypothetical protein